MLKIEIKSAICDEVFYAKTNRHAIRICRFVYNLHKFAFKEFLHEKDKEPKREDYKTLKDYNNASFLWFINQIPNNITQIITNE